MIARTQLSTGLNTTRLGLGTSRLHHISKRQRQDLLSAAADLGIAHYDTAPTYGHGIAEEELGKFLAGRRDKCVVVTKYGLALNTSSVRPSIPTIAMAAIKRRIGIGRQNLPDLNPTEMRRSVESSLRRLSTDRIDILLLHEPSSARIPDPAAIIQELNDMRKEGLLRTFGLAGEWKSIQSMLGMNDLIEILQTEESAWTDKRVPDITYGAISKGHQSFMVRSPSGTEAVEGLRRALLRRSNGVVLISTTKSQHLRDLASLPEVQES